MIKVPVSTVERPLTAIDYCAAIEAAETTADVEDFRKCVPISVLHDLRFARAVAATLARIKARRAAA